MQISVPVVVIDPASLFRDGIRRILDEASFEVRLVANTIDDAKKRIRQCGDIGLVLIDPGSDPDSVAVNLRDVRETFQAARIVVLTDRYCPTLLAASVRAGLNGFLLKSIMADVLITSLRLVMLGEFVFPPQLTSYVAAGVLPSWPHAADAPPLPKNISHRELEILRCLIDGDSNKVIARRLGITEATVKVHLKTILRKIRVDNRTQAAIWALNRGLSKAGGTAAAEPAAAPETPQAALGQGPS